MAPFPPSLSPFLPPSLPLGRERPVPQDREVGVDASFFPQVSPPDVHEWRHGNDGGKGLIKLAVEEREGGRDGGREG